MILRKVAHTNSKTKKNRGVELANIDTYLEQIAHGEYGRDVRDAIHDALEAINDSIPNSTSVSQEVISARTPGDQGLPPYDNLKQRLDTEAETLLEQAEQLATPGIRANIQITNATVGYSSLKDRLDTEYADLNRKVGRVIGRADAAATAAEEAVEVATQAKDTAVSKATEAANAASTAASKATEASSAASSASSDAQVATNRASQASTSASDAAYSANEAVMAAQQAQQAAQSVGTPDTTLTQQGKAADAKKVGDEITALKGDLSETVRFTAQTLTEAQKAQVRTNIGADSIPWFYVDEDGYMCQNVTEVVENGN